MQQLGLFSGWRFQAILGSIVLALCAYLAFSIWGGWQEVLRAFEQVGLFGLFLALLMSIVNYSLRFVRWQLYLHSMGHRVPWRSSARIYLAGFALTTTPGKAGEAVRGILLKPHRIPYPDSLAAFVSERLSDMAAIVLLALLGLSLHPHTRTLVFVGIGVVLAGLLVLSQQRLLDCLYRRSTDASSLLGRTFHHVVQMLRQARRCHSPSLLVIATALSVMGWAAEALAFMWILQWMGMEVGFSFAAFVFAAAMLAGALSFMPGGLGGTEAAMLGLLIMQGMPMPDAIAATVLIRLTTLWFAVLIGLVAMSFSRRSMQFMGD